MRNLETFSKQVKLGAGTRNMEQLKQYYVVSQPTFATLTAFFNDRLFIYILVYTKLTNTCVGLCYICNVQCKLSTGAADAK